MSDLISRSKVISILEQLEEHSLSGKMDISNAIYLLKNQPVAYDTNEVIEELKKATQGVCHYCGCDMYSEDAIKIVKQGMRKDVNK